MVANDKIPILLNDKNINKTWETETLMVWIFTAMFYKIKKKKHVDNSVKRFEWMTKNRGITRSDDDISFSTERNAEVFQLKLVQHCMIIIIEIEEVSIEEM